MDDIIIDPTFLKGGVKGRVESIYLINKNKEICSDILLKNNKTENDIIDFLISLHLVLELSVNAFFRNILIYTYGEITDEKTLYENIDNISFLEKISMFIYLNNADLSKGENLKNAKKHHSIIGKIKNFNEIRNKLLHGQAIGSFFNEMGTRHTKLKAKLYEECAIIEQVTSFKEIMEGISFYFSHLKWSEGEAAKQVFKRYLDTSFLDTN